MLITTESRVEPYAITVTNAKGHTFPPLSIIPQDVISNQITRE